MLFLNNDTRVTPGWLEALVRCLDEAPNAGLVGAKLIYPDGRLQEAGGIVFSDASGWNYGRFDDPDDPRYAFRREVDYCSGAAILLRTDLFRRLGGFDTRYAPAYYEDTDLAFAVRAAGYKVYYEPASTVVHFEGITSGTDTSTGIKRFQPINHEKFRDKWKLALARQPAPGTPIAMRVVASRDEARADRRCDDADAGPGFGFAAHGQSHARAWRSRLPHDVPARQPALGRALHAGAAGARRRGAVRAVDGRSGQVLPRARRRVRCDRAVAPLRRGELLGLARLYAPRAKLIFDTVDLHYLREQRASESRRNRNSRATRPRRARRN